MIIKKTLSQIVTVTSLSICAFTFSINATAQQPLICAGPEAVAQWAAGTDSESDISISEIPLDFESNLPNGSRRIERVIFTVSSETDVRLEAFTNGSGDPAIELYDNQGNMIAEDDDGGSGWESRTELSLSPGRYCLSAFSIDDEPIAMQLRIGRVEHDALSNGSDSAESVERESEICTAETPATDLGDGAIDELLKEGLSSTASVNDIAFYRFTTENPQHISISADGESADPVLRLFDSQGQQLAENDDYGSGYNSKIVVDALEPGNYCIGMHALDDLNIPIRMTLGIFDINAALRERYDAAEAAPLTDSNYPITKLEFSENKAQAEIILTTKASWYQFEIEEPSLIFAEAFGDKDSDPTLTIFDRTGKIIAYNDDALSEIYDSVVATRLGAGTYLIAVNKVNEDSSPNIIRFFIERYPQAGSGFWEKLF